MTNRILIKRSDELYKVPTGAELDYGELAINYKDGNLFYKNWDGAVYVIASTKAISVTGNISGGNLNLSGRVSAAGDIIGGDVFTGNVSASGMYSIGNIRVGNAIGNNWATVSVYGNVIGNYFIGDGSQLTNVAAGTANANALVGNTLSSNVLNSSLQTVGTLTALSVSGNVSVGSAISVTGNVTGNYFIGNGSQLTGIAASSANANALVGNTLSGNVLNSSLQTVGVLTSLSVSGNVNIGSAISATGNITGNYFIGDGGLLTNVAGASGNKIQDGNSYAWITSANGNIDIQVNSVANTAQFSTGAFYVSGPIATAKVINHLSLVAEDVNAVMVSPVTISASGNIFVPTSSTLTIFTPA